MTNKKKILTVQIGAMDGKNNDSMYEIFVLKRDNYSSLSNKKKELFDENLQNWLPILFEPVAHNYKALLEPYQNISNDHNLPCSIPINAIVS